MRGPRLGYIQIWTFDSTGQTQGFGEDDAHGNGGSITAPATSQSGIDRRRVIATNHLKEVSDVACT